MYAELNYLLAYHNGAIVKGGGKELKNISDYPNPSPPN